MRYAIAALIAATIYLVGRRHSWVEHAGPRALPDEYEDWLAGWRVTPLLGRDR